MRKHADPFKLKTVCIRMAVLKEEHSCKNAGQMRLEPGQGKNVCAY